MSVISGVTGAIMGSDAAEDSADAQMAAARTAAQTQLAMYNQTREDYAPWRTAGENALTSLVAKVNSGPGNYTASPGYDFRLAEGEKALNRSAAARTGLLNGAQTKALIRYGQDYATGDYDNFLNRYYQSLTPLQSIAGVGQTATAGTSNAGMNAANQIAAAQQNAGNAQAAGYINSANAIAGNIQSIGTNALAGYNAWRQYNAGNNAGVVNSNPAAYNYANTGAMTDYGSGDYFKTVDPSLL